MLLNHFHKLPKALEEMTQECNKYNIQNLESEPSVTPSTLQHIMHRNGLALLFCTEDCTTTTPSSPSFNLNCQISNSSLSKQLYF